MAHPKYSWILIAASAVGTLLTTTRAADDAKIANLKFVGAQSCASTSCHGGGIGKDQAVIYYKKDQHALAYGLVAKGTSMRMAESLGITDPVKSARCNVCHSPMQGVPENRLVKDLHADKGVSCEACHGAADLWLRFHTRPDVTYQQTVAAGMRDLNDLTVRASTCVACHLNIDEDIRKSGHPELHFELDGQTIAQPPHYRDERPSIGLRSWLTGQATALREISWKLASKPEPELEARWKGLVWLLEKTAAGKNALPESGGFAAMQSAADQLAHTAAKALWTKESTTKQLRDYISSSPEFTDAKADKIEMRRRAEVLIPSIERLWIALKKEGGVDPVTFEPALTVASDLAREQADFDPVKFGRALEQIEVAFERMQK